MNEQRNNRYLYFSAPDSLQDNWDNLLNRLKTLEYTARSLRRNDLIVQIVRQETVMYRNKPHKKIYRAILKIVDKIELQLNSNERTR